MHYFSLRQEFCNLWLLLTFYDRVDGNQAESNWRTQMFGNKTERSWKQLQKKRQNVWRKPIIQSQQSESYNNEINCFAKGLSRPEAQDILPEVVLRTDAKMTENSIQRLVLMGGGVGRRSMYSASTKIDWISALRSKGTRADTQMFVKKICDLGKAIWHKISTEIYTISRSKLVCTTETIINSLYKTKQKRHFAKLCPEQDVLPLIIDMSATQTYTQSNSLRTAAKTECVWYWDHTSLSQTAYLLKWNTGNTN